MPRIPFLLVRTFDPGETLASLEDRFLRHLGKLRGVDPFADEGWELTESASPDCASQARQLSP